MVIDAPWYEYPETEKDGKPMPTKEHVKRLTKQNAAEIADIINRSNRK